ncbi:MAG: AzlC family ABC transporter permease [Lentisphaerae bacterium]|nr:AzlC family ABC transporter permease [Lentisphaerota bacterium]
MFLMKKKNWQSAFKDTLPVLMGYLAMGAAAGIVLAGTLPTLPAMPLWGTVSSTLSISGALQFIMVDWLKESIPLTDVVLLTLFLNLRYAMYGFSLIERFEGIPRWKKWYLIWTLTDETYALQCADKRQDKQDSVDYCMKVAFLDHCYWVSGVSLGALVGSALPFNCRGIDFAMTALFLVILTDQLREKSNKLPALTGFAAALLARCFFPVDKMLIPAMIVMTAVFLIFRKKFQSGRVVKK